tara:strand:- start:548 stop:940 length:393 start_codon:yes stop_codon:yes gene_type:complete
MQKLKMIPCPKCGEPFPELRKTLYNYFTCVNCSTTDKVVGITTVEGSGDHTWNDIIIMDRKKAIGIAKKEAELTGRKVDIEMIDFDKDEAAVTQSVEEKVSQSLDPQEEATNYDVFDPNKEFEGIQGIDY